MDICVYVFVCASVCSCLYVYVLDHIMHAFPCMQMFTCLCVLVYLYEPLYFCVYMRLRVLVDVYLPNRVYPYGFTCIVAHFFTCKKI